MKTTLEYNTVEDVYIPKDVSIFLIFYLSLNELTNIYLKYLIDFVSFAVFLGGSTT